MEIKFKRNKNNLKMTMKIINFKLMDSYVKNLQLIIINNRKANHNHNNILIYKPVLQFY